MNVRQSQQKVARGKPDSAFKACQRLNRKKKKAADNRENMTSLFNHFCIFSGFRFA